MMPKCERCGKRGLFLKLNSSGLCEICEIRDRISREKDKYFSTEPSNLKESAASPSAKSPAPASHEAPSAQEHIDTSFNSPRDYEESLRRYELCSRDTEYQKKLNRYFSSLEKANEKYSVLNSLNLFQSEQGLDLISLCKRCIKIEAEIKEKREYYQNFRFESSPPYKLLAMVYDKRAEYDKVVETCVCAIKAGYISDGTKGGMRGRLARAMKRGNIEMTPEITTILGI